MPISRVYLCAAVALVALIEAILLTMHAFGDDARLNSALCPHEVYVRYTCFGETVAWTIYADSNFLEQPDLDDWRRAGHLYQGCVRQANVKNYMPSLDPMARS